MDFEILGDWKRAGVVDVKFAVYLEDYDKISVVKVPKSYGLPYPAMSVTATHRRTKKRGNVIVPVRLYYSNFQMVRRFLDERLSS